MSTTQPPRVGATIALFGQLATVIRTYPFGTVDAQLPSGRCYRITGLAWLSR